MLLLISSCDVISDDTNNDDMSITHSIIMYQYNSPDTVTSGECSGVVGISKDINDKFNIKIDVISSIDNFDFKLELPVSYVSDTKEKIAGNMYDGSKYTCYVDTTKYVVSLVYPTRVKKQGEIFFDEPKGGIFWIIDYDGKSVILLAGKRLD